MKPIIFRAPDPDEIFKFIHPCSSLLREDKHDRISKDPSMLLGEPSRHWRRDWVRVEYIKMTERFKIENAVPIENRLFLETVLESEFHSAEIETLS